MNLKEIRQILDLMNEHDLMEIEIEREGTKIKLKKSGADSVEIMPQIPISVPAKNISAAASQEAPAVEVNSTSSHQEIKSPMVGTFYRSPSPEAPSYIEAGQMVEVGQVVCIVEAMKLMNEIKSEVKGKVVEALVDNAQPVEFGQTLFTIEPV